jgi:ABC-type glycerol-3-phosphate transport system substrate-binding protein
VASPLLTRRRLLASIGLFAVAAPALAACGGAPAAPTAAPTAAPKAAEPTKPAAAAPTTAPAATTAVAKAPSAGSPVDLSLAVFPDRPWMKRWAQKWLDQNPGSKLKIDDIPYADMNTKQLTLLASGTMEDVVFSGNKWLRYSAFKGAFRSMDDFIKTKPYDKDDMIASAVDGGAFESKQYGLPSEWNPGNINVVMYNKDMIQAKGVKDPTDKWTHEEFTDFVVKMTDNAKQVYGTDIFPITYYDFGDNVRDLGGDVMSDDGKKFLFGTDPKCREVAQWFADFRVKYKAAPNRAGMQQEQLFPTGKIASTATNAVSVKSIAKQIGDKFKWGVVLGPTGKEGLRGYDSFSLHWNIYSKSKNPDRAYDLILVLSSKEAATDALRSEGQVPARLSVWRDPVANDETDIFKRVADWVADPRHKGPFPIPANLRYTELETTYENVGYPMFYGEMDFEEGLKKTQEECQKIMDQPRG